MEYALAVASSGKLNAVSLVTSRDTRKPCRDEAIRLARETVATTPATLVKEHEAVWAQYWSASGVELDDPDFQPWWCRMAYFLRCFAKPGVVPAGLWGVLPIDTLPQGGRPVAAVSDGAGCRRPAGGRGLDGRQVPRDRRA